MELKSMSIAERLQENGAKITYQELLSVAGLHCGPGRCYGIPNKHCVLASLCIHSVWHTIGT